MPEAPGKIIEPINADLDDVANSLVTRKKYSEKNSANVKSAKKEAIII